jgi:hypothetical protein
MSKAKSSRNEYKAMRILQAAGYHTLISFLSVSPVRQSGKGLAKVQCLRREYRTRFQTIRIMHHEPFLALEMRPTAAI